MYVPKFNKAISTEAVLSFIKKYSFANTICYHNSNYHAAHIPLEIEERKNKLFITGHVAVANPLVTCIRAEATCLNIFAEPHAYVSSSWYDHVNVPTWNYIAVHLTGNFRELSGKELLNSIRKMVDHYEEGRENRYKIEDMPDEMLQAHLNGLVGFEIKVDQLEANFKLSQNRNDKNYFHIIDKLIESGNPLEKEIALEMKKLREKQ